MVPRRVLIDSQGVMHNPLVDKLIQVKRRLVIWTRLRKAVRWLAGWIQDLYWDWRLGVWTGGVIQTPYKARGAHNTESIRYAILRRMFEQVEIAPDDVLVDVGCGKGRVMHWWRAQGYPNRIIGVELDAQVATATAARFAGDRNIEVIAGDIIDQFPNEGTLFWLYNPFGPQVMRRFRDRLKQAVRREVRIVYTNPRFVEAFQEDPAFVLEPLDAGCLVKWHAYLIRFRGGEGIGKSS